MTKIRLFLAAVALAMCVSAASAANRYTTVYVYGFAASFNDSTVYFTNIQQIDSAMIDTKTRFLYGRQEYSYQLRDYLTAQGFEDATCVTGYALTRKEAEQKFQKLRKKYTDKGNYAVKDLDEASFRYQAVKE